MSKSKVKRPHPGLGVIVLKDNHKVLMGKRKDTGLYCGPGGLLEMFETWEQAAARELKEETGLDVKEDKLHVIKVFNAIDKSANYHNVAIITLCEFPEDQEVKNMEADKCEGWEWWTLEEIYKRIDEIFYPMRQLMTEYKELFDPENTKRVFSSNQKYKSTYFE